MALGILVQPVAGLVNPAFLPDAGQHILKRPARGHMIMDVIGGNQRHPGTRTHGRQKFHAAAVITVVKAVDAQIERAGECSLQALQSLFKSRIRNIRREGYKNLALGMVQHVGQVENAIAFLRSALAQGQELAEPSVGRPVAGITQQAQTLLQVEPASDDKADVLSFCRYVCPHGAGKRVAVGHRDCGKALPFRRCDKLIGMRPAAQKAEIGRDLQFGISGHRNGA